MECKFINYCINEKGWQTPCNDGNEIAICFLIPDNTAGRYIPKVGFRIVSNLETKVVSIFSTRKAAWTETDDTVKMLYSGNPEEFYNKLKKEFAPKYRQLLWEYEEWAPFK